MKSMGPLHGLMVEFTTSEEILRATQRTWQAGYRQIDAYTPYPVEGLALALGLRRGPLPSIVLIGGLVGAASGFAMQFYSMAFDYPFNAGGRPTNSWPVFIPITFEMLILVASVSALLGLLFVTGLPRLHHPVFYVPGFERASQDRFFLCIEANDSKFDLEETSRFLLLLSPLGPVVEVPRDSLRPPREPTGAGLQGAIAEQRVAPQVGEQEQQR